MAPARFSVERTIPAPPEALYALLTDYGEGHPGILPPAFSDYALLEGGIGAGTRIRFRFTVAGRARTMEGRVSEPEPGRVLEETYEDGSVTRFTIDPTAQGSRLLIETEWDARGGLTGLLERLMVSRLLGPVYRDELDRIEAWARERPAPGADPHPLPPLSHCGEERGNDARAARHFRGHHPESVSDGSR